MALEMPKSIKDDAFKSAKWNEIVTGRKFEVSDIPTISLLCQWYAVIERCISDLDMGDELPRVAYQNEIGDVKAFPQLATMKQASAEIRALNKQLGINDSVEIEHKDNITPLQVIQDRRNKKASAIA